jgi:DNA-binding MarR family transcriptional regulator
VNLPKTAPILLDTAARRLARCYDAELRKVSLDWVSYTLLSVLSLGDRARTVGLVRALGLSSGVIGSGLRRLQRHGWVRPAAGADRRKRYWQITAAGQKARRAGDRCWRRAQEMLREEMGSPALVALLTSLNALDRLRGKLQ